MNDVREEAQRQLDAVRRDFEARLASMLDEIVCAWEAAKAASDRDAMMSKLVELVHRLAGNAGFFGLSKISSDASELEQACERALDKGVNEDRVDEINRLLGMLKGQQAP